MNPAACTNDSCAIDELSRKAVQKIACRFELEISSIKICSASGISHGTRKTNTLHMRIWLFTCLNFVKSFISSGCSWEVPASSWCLFFGFLLLWGEQTRHCHVGLQAKLGVSIIPPYKISSPKYQVHDITLSSACLTWLYHSCFQHDSHPHVQHDSIIYICDVTRSSAWLLFKFATWVASTCAEWLDHSHAICLDHPHVQHDFIIHICNTALKPSWNPAGVEPKTQVQWNKSCALVIRTSPVNARRHNNPFLQKKWMLGLKPLRRRSPKQAPPPH